MKTSFLINHRHTFALLLIVAAVLLTPSANADWTQARCEVSANGSDNTTVVLPCVFSQRQGHINIDRSDGVALDLKPLPDGPGNYQDQNGLKVIRKSSEDVQDDNAQIFMTNDALWKVYWTVTTVKANPEAGGQFDQTLVLRGISFRISSPNNTSLSPVKIEAAGLELGNTVLDVEADGIITGAEVADLDVNGSPELYIYTASAGSGSYGGLIAYAVNNGKSLSEIYLPPIGEGDDAAVGYMGHDDFAVVETTLVRRFPLYKTDDTNAKPSGGTRQLQYKLEPGEAGWVLRPDKVIDF